MSVNSFLENLGSFTKNQKSSKNKESPDIRNNRNAPSLKSPDIRHLSKTPYWWGLNHLLDIMSIIGTKKMK